MADITVLYWRDIPAQVVARAGRSTARRELSLRFQEAIDMAAMRDGARDEDAYLAGWRKGAPESCGADLELEAERTSHDLESAYGPDRLRTLVRNGGREAGS
jgi:hypothetical protein